MKNLRLCIIGLFILGTFGCSKTDINSVNVPIKNMVFENVYKSLKLKYPQVELSLIDESNVESRNNSECRPPTTGSNCIEYQLSNFPVIMGSCTILVTSMIRQCQTDGVTHYAGFWDFSYVFSPGSNCFSWPLQWSDLYLTHKYSDLETAMYGFYRDLTRKFEREYLANFVLSIPICGEGYSNIGEFYEKNCTKLCATLDTSSEEPFYNLSMVKCGDACCRRLTAYCLNPFTDEPIPFVVEAEPWGEPECDPVTVTCNGQQVPNINCKNPCERI